MGWGEEEGGNECEAIKIKLFWWDVCILGLIRMLKRMDTNVMNKFIWVGFDCLSDLDTNVKDGYECHDRLDTNVEKDGY